MCYNCQPIAELESNNNAITTHQFIMCETIFTNLVRISLKILALVCVDPISGLTNAPLRPRTWAKYSRQSSASGRLLVRHTTSREFWLFIDWSVLDTGRSQAASRVAECPVTCPSRSQDEWLDCPGRRPPLTSCVLSELPTADFTAAVVEALICCLLLLLLDDLLALQWNYLVQQLAEFPAALKGTPLYVLATSYFIDLVIFFLKLFVISIICEFNQPAIEPEK